MLPKFSLLALAFLASSALAKRPDTGDSSRFGLKVSPRGSCGGHDGYTCLGYDDGQCCSKYGYWYR
jgi:hypothetical protein